MPRVRDKKSKAVLDKRDFLSRLVSVFLLKKEILTFPGIADLDVRFVVEYRMSLLLPVDR